MTLGADMAWPLVSLVTPAYNQAHYLVETIDSVLAQDYPNLEYVVIDDGSTDDTAAVLARYADRVRFQRQTNQGQASTLNNGWAMCRGSLLGYLSSDDRLAPHAVRRLVECLLAHPQAQVAYGDFRLIDARGQALRAVQTEDFDARRLAVDLVCQPGVGALFRRGILDAAGGWRPHLRQVPDFEFWLRAARSGPFVRVPQVLADYRIHEGSASFRPAPPQRSDELVGVMRDYWAADSMTGDARRSQATAHVIAAKSHAQSGRVATALSRWRHAWRLDRKVACSRFALRALASGLLRRLYYRLRGSPT
jgi:glycosyltransferase involved in cell wall biosynthesis